MVDAAEFLPLLQGGLAGRAPAEPVARCQHSDMPQNHKDPTPHSLPNPAATAAAAAAVAVSDPEAALGSAAPAVQAAVAKAPGDLSKLLIDQVY